MSGPLRILITVDAVGGVWRYAADLAQGLTRRGAACLLVGMGPRGDAGSPPGSPDLVWIDQPLDWLVEDEAALDNIPSTLSALAREWRADLLHLNLPSQAVGLPEDLPVLVASHSCVPSWWEAVRGTALPPAWQWQHRRNRRGLDRAAGVLVPSASHAAALERIYGPMQNLHVVHNATTSAGSDTEKQPFVLAAGRWWDEGKNAAALDQAARCCAWPVVMAGSLAAPDGQVVELRHAHAPGAVPSETLQAMMRDAAIFVAPSRYEPFGLAVLEAATCRAALVLSDIPTFREIWEGAAIFVPANEADGFAAAINRLATDAPMRRTLGRKAARIAATLSPARQLDGVMAAYAEVLKQCRPCIPERI